eukprot:scaffold2716_cov179-Amphora_coffeaeformis.AAC.12
MEPGRFFVGVPVSTEPATFQNTTVWEIETLSCHRLRAANDRSTVWDIVVALSGFGEHISNSTTSCFGVGVAYQLLPFILRGEFYYTKDNEYVAKITLFDKLTGNLVLYDGIVYGTIQTEKNLAKLDHRSLTWFFFKKLHDDSIHGVRRADTTRRYNM